MYRNTTGSRYEALKTYYPVWYRDVTEMDAIWRVSGGQLDGMEEGIVRFLLNCFLQSADEPTIARWEDFLWITYDGERTLAERRMMVSQFFNGTGHIGEKEIKEIVGAFTSGQIEVDLVGGAVHITVTRDLAERFILSDCVFILSKRMPAHLEIVFNDMLLPIRFYTSNRFRLESVRFENSFYNFGTDVIMLDGRRLLDGTWRMNQTFSYRLDMDVFRLILGTAMIYPGAGLPVLRASPAPFNTRGRGRVFSFGAHIGTAKTPTAFSNPQTGFTMAAQNDNALTGFVTVDSMYHLDGSVLLDGSRRLNAKHEREEL